MLISSENEYLVDKGKQLVEKKANEKAATVSAIHYHTLFIFFRIRFNGSLTK